MLSQLKKNLSNHDKDLKNKKISSVKLANKAYDDYKNYTQVATEKESKGKKMKAINMQQEAEKLKKEDSILKLINKTTELIYSQEIEVESQKAASLFFFGLIFSLTVFLIFWFLSFNFSILGNYFNNIFCRVKSQ